MIVDGKYNANLVGRVLEWKWLIPNMYFWRLMSENNILAEVRKKKRGSNNFFYTVNLKDVKFEVRLETPESVRYITLHTVRHSPIDVVRYSIKRMNSATKDGERMKVGTIEHGFGPYLSPSKIFVRDKEYSIGLSFQDKYNREFAIKRIGPQGSGVVALASRTKTNPEWRAAIPGSFRLISLLKDDIDPILLSGICFIFSDIVHHMYDSGWF